MGERIRHDPPAVGPYGRVEWKGGRPLAVLTDEGRRVFEQTLAEFGGNCVKYLNRTPFRTAVWWARDGGLSRDEIQAACAEGLLAAVARWRPEKGATIRTYAAWWMRLKLQRLTEQAATCYRQTGKAEFTDPRTRDGAGVLDEQQARPDADLCPVARDRRRALAAGIRRALRQVTQRDREVFASLYGLDDGEPKTLEACAKVFGIHRERVRQIAERVRTRIARDLAELYSEAVA